jgi:hypothetical protein
MIHNVSKEDPWHPRNTKKDNKQLDVYALQLYLKRSAQPDT